jgi:aryl-alcohol dehydrogenase-like predicted oxidoreductase
LRLGVAGNYGLETGDIFHAAERGVGFWLWSPRFKTVTPALRELLARDRARHVVAALDFGYTAGMVRRGVEKARRTLGVDQLDLFLMAWLGRGSFFTKKIQACIVQLKEEGRVQAFGTSIHDRRRAGQLARDSVLDAFMIRYNAKHPGAEQDIFPHLAARNPLVIAYTVTSWRQLLRPVPGIEMPAWPGPVRSGGPPPPLSPGLCYRFVLTSPDVHLALTGPKTRDQLDENLDSLQHGPLVAEEEAWVREYGRKLRAGKKRILS